jgi:hypothetical protein
MTKQEALKPKKKLDDNSLPPALSTRSNDRKLDQVNIIYIIISKYIHIYYVQNIAAHNNIRSSKNDGYYI